MSTALSTLTASLQAQMTWTATLVQTGLNLKQDQETPTKKLAFALGTGAGLCNEVVTIFNSTAGSGNTSIDVTSQTDVCGQTVNLSVVKGIFIWLLGANDLALDGTTAGNACSSITINGTISNALLSSSNSGWLSNATSKFDIANSNFILWGTGSAGGITVSSTNKIINIVNNDATNAAKVVTVLLGNG